MYLYLFILFLTASLRNDALGGLTYIIPDDYYQLNAYDFGNLSAGLVIDDNGISYVEGFYYVKRNSENDYVYTTNRGYGHIRFNDNQKFALDIKFNKLIEEGQNVRSITPSAEMAACINNVSMGIGWGKNIHSKTHINGSFLYLNKFSIGSKIEYIMHNSNYSSYHRIIATLYSAIPITDNLRVAGKTITRESLQYFNTKIRFEFTPMKEIVISTGIMGTILKLFPISLSTEDPQSLTFGIGYKKDPVFVGIENSIEREKVRSDLDYIYYSINRMGVEVYKKGFYVRTGMNKPKLGKSYTFSFGLGYSKDKLDIDYLYNYYSDIEECLGYVKEHTNGLSIRVKF